MVRSDKQNTICERCGNNFSTPQKLRNHLNRKFKCKPLERPSSEGAPQRGKEAVASKTEPVQEVIQQKPVQEIQSTLAGTSTEAKNLEFREQDLGIAVKRRAIAVYNSKVPKSHPDNGSDIQKMLESRRNQFKELLEKEFDKRGQFKFALCSLIKFLIDDKPAPGKEAEKRKNSRRDWLRNKQIIVYNRAEINDYLTIAFEQILNQVEERGGKSAS
jgi:hypothetical protein